MNNQKTLALYTKDVLFQETKRWHPGEIVHAIEKEFDLELRRFERELSDGEYEELIDVAEKLWLVRIRGISKADRGLLAYEIVKRGTEKEFFQGYDKQTGRYVGQLLLVTWEDSIPVTYSVFRINQARMRRS